MFGLSRNFSWLVCLLLIFSALTLLAQAQQGAPWQDASAPNGSAPTGAQLIYYGGPVVSNAVIVQVLYGPGAYNPQVAGTSTPTMGKFFGDLLGIRSGYINLLSQYNTNVTGGTNQIIGNGTFDGIFQITPAAGNNGSTIDDSSIQNELLAQISAGHLPVPVLDPTGNVNTIYMIYFPPGKTITKDARSSCMAGGFCAYHRATSNTFGGKHLLYGVMPDMQAGSGCSTGCGTSGIFGNYTSLTSHELAEVITDADKQIAPTLDAPAWWDPFNGAEIGDLCSGQQGSYVANGTTYTIQFEFSNAVKNCVLPAQAPLGAPHVGQLFWTSGVGWAADGQIANAGGANAASGSAVSAFVDSTTGQQHVFYIGADQRVHQFFWASGVRWSADNQIANAGGPNAASGSGVSAFVDTATGQQHVFYVGTDQRVHQFFWTSGAGWAADNQIANAGGANAASGSGVSAFVDTATGQQHVFYIGTDQRVHQFFWTSGVGWAADSQIANVGGPNAASGSAVSAFVDNTSGQQHVFYIGTEQRVHRFYWAPGVGWTADGQIATTDVGGVKAATGSGLSAFVDTASGQQHVFYIGADQRVHQFFWASGAGWTADGQIATTTVGGANAAFGSAVSAFVDSTSGQQHVFYDGLDQNVHQFYWTSGAGWTADVQIGIIGAPSEISGSGLSAFVDPSNGQQHVFYIRP